MHRYLISAVEQALWSVLNLGVNLLLIRFTAPAHYGAFAFWANTGFVLSSLQNALTVCHLQVLAPSGVLDEPRLGVERLMHMVTVLFLAAVAAITLAGVSALGQTGSALATPAAALFLPAFLLQQYIRALAFTRDRPATAALQTAMVLVMAVSLLALAYLDKAMTANRVLLSLGLAYGLVGLGGAGLAVRSQLGGRPWPALSQFRRHLTQSGWIFLGVSSTELLTRFYAFVVIGWFGPVALASLSATQQLLRPVPLLATSWSMVGRTDLARRREAGDWGGFSRSLILALGGGGVVAALWAGLVFNAWPLITRHLFGGKYAAEGWMVLLWGVASAIGFGQVVVSAGLQALHAFKGLALANAAASVAAAGAILLIMRVMGYQGAIVGTAIGQTLELAAMAALLVAMVRQRRGLGA